MRNEKLIRAYDRAAPTQAQQEEMLEHILARRNEPAGPARDRRKTVRRAILIAAVLLAAAASVVAGRMAVKWSLPEPTPYQPTENGSYDVHETKQYPDTTQPETDAPAEESAPAASAPTDAELIVSAKEILTRAGLTDVDTSAAEVTRQENLSYGREEAEVAFTQNRPQTTVKFSASTGELLSLSSFSETADVPAEPVCATEEETEALARKFYAALPVEQGYILTGVNKYDDELWSYEFCRSVTEEIYNPYEMVRLCVNRSTGRLTLCNVFDFPLLDDHDEGDVMLTQEEAIAAAAEQSGMDMSGYTLTEARVACVLPNWFFTGSAWSGDLQYAKVSRLAWQLTYEQVGGEITTEVSFCVDAYTGELLGGGMT